MLLAAGQGTQIRPLTDGRPKPILPVAGKPVVAHTAVASGVSQLVIVFGYEASAVREYFGDHYQGVPVEFAAQTAQHGTADAVRAATLALDEGPFAVLNGDAVYDHDSLSTLYDTVPAVGSFEVDNPCACGVLHTDTTGSGTWTTGVTEKPVDPPSNLIYAGAYAFSAATQEWLAVEESERGELELTDVFSWPCREPMVRMIPSERWLDVGRP